MRRHRRLAPRRVYLAHLARNFAWGSGIIAACLAVGAVGYHATERLPWLDAVLNAAMLLGGEGPVTAPRTAAGKLFATIYALFGGVLFITAAGVALAPAARRFLHRFHLELYEPEGEEPEGEEPENPAAGDGK
ncbi:MAG TPA: hypothetical protein VFS05_09485 [Gemmatimonadaceae bacterium]|nr:hypothetical protein [Gemmatimonadaceae bacterium]